MRSMVRGQISVLGDLDMLGRGVSVDNCPAWSSGMGGSESIKLILPFSSSSATVVCALDPGGDQTTWKPF